MKALMGNLLSRTQVNNKKYDCRMEHEKKVDLQVKRLDSNSAYSKAMLSEGGRFKDDNCLKA